jgi:hypothetical protein
MFAFWLASEFASSVTLSLRAIIQEDPLSLKCRWTEQMKAFSARAISPLCGWYTAVAGNITNAQLTVLLAHAHAQLSVSSELLRMTG